MSVHGGKLAARALKKAGVECVFTLSGGHVMAIYDGCLDEGIPVIDVRHEQAAVHAADAWSRLNPGSIGCAILTAGPGVTDGVTGVANAWRANSPILVIGGQGPFDKLRMGSLQEMDHVGVMRPITKWADACYDTARIPDYIEMGVRHAISGNPGPAFLEIPMDVLMGRVESMESVRWPKFRRTAPQLAPLEADCREALEILASAKRPVLMAGTSVKWSNASAGLNAFLERTQIPTYVNGMGRGTVPPGSNYLLNRSRKDAMKQCDVFICAGVLLDFRLGFGNSIPADAKIIQLDIENELIGQNRSADVGIVGNIGASFETILKIMDDEKQTLDFSGWLNELKPREAELEAAVEADLNSNESPVDPLRMCREVRDFLADFDQDCILIGDGGDIVAQASKVLPVPAENGWMDPGPLGTLGVGMPFALAAQASQPDKRVLIIYGDGSFGLNGFEYDTAIRFNLPIVGIVGNDAAWGQMIRPQATIYGSNRLVATKLNYTRYDKIVEAMGGHGEYVERPEDIRPALERAFASGKPALVNVKLRQDVDTGMKGSTYA
ncbi:MAG TPA: acetolactate synthase [Alphaproteobacteria bacterium]|nr:acetolactate synthase [Alphaproteobacteria bacterium]HBA44020.1 acetolactate synthase [Alphaproteobacteria bacterium]HBC54665.1 acetolactate synthase [Alphaproteobacteria bacterium]